SPEPPDGDPGAILTRRRDRLAREQVDPKAGEVAPRGDRELQRPPKPPVPLHQPRRVYAIVAKLDQRRPVPWHGLEQPLGARAQSRVDGDGAPQARAGARRSNVPQALVGEPGHGPAVVAHREYALALSGNEALDHGPVPALTARQHRLVELGLAGDIAEAGIGHESQAIPRGGEPGFHDAGISDGTRRR